MNWGSNHRAVTLQGTLMVKDWNERGNLVALAIVTDEGDACFVKNGEKQKEMFRHLRRKVRVTGILRKTEEGKLITVNKYSLIDDGKTKGQNKIGRFNFMKYFMGKRSHSDSG